jgi:hypothetical protein
MARMNERSSIVGALRSLLFEFRDAPCQTLQHGIRVDRSMPTEDSRARSTGVPVLARSRGWLIRCRRKLSY